MRFGIRDLLLATTVVAVHLALVTWRFGGLAETLPASSPEWIACFPSGLVIALAAYRRLRLGAPVATLPSAHSNWKPSLYALAGGHLFLFCVARNVDAASYAFFLHQLLALGVAYGLMSSAVIVYRTGLAYGFVYLPWGQTNPCLAFNDGEWWLRAAPGQDASVRLIEVQLSDEAVEPISMLLKEEYSGGSN